MKSRRIDKLGLCQNFGTHPLLQTGFRHRSTLRPTKPSSSSLREANLTRPIRASGSESTRMSTSLSGRRSPHAADPKTASSLTPYRLHISEIRSLGSSIPELKVIWRSHPYYAGTHWQRTERNC